MPNSQTAPRAGLLAEMDWTAFAGVVAFAGGNNVTVSSGWTWVDDTLQALCGLGSEDTRSLRKDAVAVGTGAGGWTFGIDEDDRFYIENDTETFDLTAAAGNAVWGLPAAGASAVLVSGTTYRLTATADWTRGNLEGATFELDPATGLAFTLPSVAYRAQDLPTLIRTRGDGYTDDNYPATCIEALDNAANDATHKRIRWGISADGLVWRARPSGVAAGLTWAGSSAATTLRRLLGFTGSESGVTTGGLVVETATHPAAGVLTPSRPVEKVTTRDRWMGSALELSDGSVAYNTVDQRTAYSLRLYIDGPADRIDRGIHYAERWLRYAPPGARVNWYQDFGDTRRAQRAVERDDAYSLDYTIQRNGDGYGMLRVRRAAGSTKEDGAEWPARIRRRAPVTMTLVEREGGQ